MRRAIVAAAGAGLADGEWRELRLEWDDGPAPTSGWWRVWDDWVMTITGDSPSAAPEEIR